MKRTKSMDLSFYRHFFKYNNPEDIDTKKMAGWNIKLEGNSNNN